MSLLTSQKYDTFQSFCVLDARLKKCNGIVHGSSHQAHKKNLERFHTFEIVWVCYTFFTLTFSISITVLFLLKKNLPCIKTSTYVSLANHGSPLVASTIHAGVAKGMAGQWTDVDSAAVYATIHLVLCVGCVHQTVSEDRVPVL